MRTITKIFLSFLFIPLLAINLIAEEAKEECHIDWPRGWKVTPMPQFTDQNNKDFGGKRVRAFLNNGEELKVAIEYACVPLNGRKLSLEGEFEAAAKAIQAGYQKMGLKAEFSPVQKNVLNQTATNEAEITVVAPETKLHQSLLIAVDQTHLYSLSYTGVEAEFQSNLKTYQEVRASLGK